MRRLSDGSVHALRRIHRDERQIALTTRLVVDRQFHRQHVAERRKMVPNDLFRHLRVQSAHKDATRILPISDKSIAPSPLTWTPLLRTKLPTIEART